MRTRRHYVLTLTCLAALVALPVAAQEGAFTGGFQIGFRTVDVGGSPTKFKEDINLEEGPRLFRLDLKYIPEDAMRKFADRVTIDVNNFGGDPFETLSISVDKFGRYDFDFDRRKSNYFYNDVILPVELAGNPALGLAGDFHHFDFDRVHDRANFKIWVTEDAILNFGLNRYTRKGDSTTTLDISRDEFEFDKPIDESLNDYLGSFQYSWDKVTLVLEQRYRDFKNAIELFLPGRSLGEDPADATILDFYFFDQPTDYTSSDSIVRLIAQPSDKLLVRAQADFQKLDLDFNVEETGAGIAFNGQPLEIDNDGRGEVNRDLDLFDLDVTYRLNERWALVFGGRSYQLDQRGDRIYAEESGTGTWKIDTTSLELGAQVHLSPAVTVAAGVRDEKRKLDSRWELGGDELDERVDTDQTGYFANVGWAPRKGCRVHFEYESSSFDNPYALASPTDRQRYNVRGQYRLDNGFWVLGSFAVNDFENNLSGWDSSAEQLNVRFGYDKDKLLASVGYSTIDVERRIDQTVSYSGFGAGPPTLFMIRYMADSEFLDGRFRYDASERFALGGDFRLYDNTGSFGIEREDYRAWIEVGFGAGYVTHLGYRTVDFDEKDFNWDDYDANILEVSIGYRW